MDIEESVQKVDPGEKKCSCQDSNPRPFDHKSDTLTTELSLPPGRGYEIYLS